MGRTTIQQHWETPGFHRHFRTGISLHGHTCHSIEDLKFLGGFRGHFPVIPAVLRMAAWQHRRATGETLDIHRAGWRPPLDPPAALDVETRQIHGLGLDALVSLTDHDDLEAGIETGTPISVEWTVPFGSTFFHFGIHNLPETRSGAIWGVLRGYTERPSGRGLAEALDLLAHERSVLVVLNHPLWDEAGIGEAAHAGAVARLLVGCGARIHAIELNGLRSWAENQAVMRLAAAWRKPLISGGDRHGAEPNANINLSQANSFAGFVEEVRQDGQSTILFLPQYREPLRLRWLQTVWDVVRAYPEAQVGQRDWSERFFYRAGDGVRRSVAEMWKTSRPPLLSQALAMLRVAELETLRPALRALLADR